MKLARGDCFDVHFAEALLEELGGVVGTGGFEVTSVINSGQRGSRAIAFRLNGWRTFSRAAINSG